ncbi:MAG: rubrerythrin family protein [Christensenellaceae bacterium]|jgi:rubrerythrin|nr:rubrerythrin family protein [Christensenellaceae bacterium]
MKNLKNSKTYVNLARAFAGECMARTRYEFIAYGARAEGQRAIAERIERIAFNEFNHSRMFYSFIQSANTATIQNIEFTAGYPFREKWVLLDNLKFAADDENAEAEEVYARAAKEADEEGFADIAGLFRNVQAVERQHREEFLDLYNQLKNGSLYKKDAQTVWKCPDCGYEASGKEAFTDCPLCHAKQGSVSVKTPNYLPGGVSNR